MKRLLVTGSSGYLGSNFIQKYQSIYNFSFFSLLSDKLERVELNSVNAILHCAAIAHNKQKASSGDYEKINVNYPYELAHMAKSRGVKQFIFISSVSVYGEKEFINHKSDTNPTSAYGRSKLKAEKKLLTLNDSSFTISILRIPMIYGPKAPGNIETLTKLLNHLPIIPLGNIDNKRTFISISNVLQSINTILEKKKGGVFLLSDEESISTSKLVSILINKIGKKRILVDSILVKYFIKALFPSIYNKLWGSMVIDSSLSRSLLDLDFSKGAKKEISDMLKFK